MKFDCSAVEIENLANCTNNEVFAIYIFVTSFNCLQNIIKSSQTTDYIQSTTFLLQPQHL